MFAQTHYARWTGVLPAMVLLLVSSHAFSQDAPLAKTNVQGGVVVHVGCGDGRFTATLGGESFRVQGLDTDAANVAEARSHIHALGLSGKVTVAKFDGEHLPYVDALVNLLIAEELGDLTTNESLRVLVPGGTALVKQNGVWQKTVKPWPDEIDSWTHFLHDASNNAVAQDTRVGPPRGLKWQSGPLWSRSHEFVSSTPAMISAGGRMFYVMDEGLTSVTAEPIPERWMLIARDAFNGVLLWKRPMPQWRGPAWRASLRARPAGVPRRIVGDSRRLYATLSHGGPLEFLDPATGRSMQTVEGTDNTEEILLSGRTLVVRMAPVTARREKPTGQIAAIDADSGRELWRVSAPQYVAATLAALDEHVVFNTGTELVCLALDSGKELWRQAVAKSAQVVILHNRYVIENGGNKITARSLESGEILWSESRGEIPANTAQDAMRPADIFVAQGCVWHASPQGITGRDLTTGKPARIIDASSVQSPGHHLRCYPAKATENFLITQFRGAEFVSLTDDNHANNDWVRGACALGIMPGNGLLYVPPNPCFCYPGAKMTGLLALTSDVRLDGDRIQSTDRLEQGPAFGSLETTPGATADEWPMYRQNARRSGATLSEVPAQVSRQWEIDLPGPLTPPVVAQGRVFVAAKDRHTLYALDAGEGQELWHFVAGGRIDSAPTVLGDALLFGCADGSVYCLRAADGQLAWRFRAAPDDRQIVAFEQLESPWRVHGSVLVEEGLVYCTAGRSTFLDGGIWIYALDPQTGRVVHQTRLDTASPVRKDFEGQPFLPSYHMEGGKSDLLVSQGGYLYLGQYRFDRELNERPSPYGMPDPDNPVVAMDISAEPYTASGPEIDKGYEHIRTFHHYMETAHPELSEQYKQTYGGMNMGDRLSGMHLSASAGFLDDTWFNRTYWMVSGQWPGWYLAHRSAKTGQLLVVGPKRTFALQAFPTRNKQSPLFTPGDKGYLLLADDNDTQPVLDDETRGATKGLGYTRLEPPAWHDWIPIRVRGMALAGQHLFVAGPPDVLLPNDPMASFEGRQGAVLRVYSADDGSQLSETKLKSPPVFDGLIAAGGRLFVSTTDGRVVCLGGK